MAATLLSLPKKIVKRLDSIFYQVGGMLKTLSPIEKLHYLALCLRFAKSIVVTNRLLKVDDAISKKIQNLHFKLNRQSIFIPFKKMETEMDRLGNDGASLELVRELFGNCEYLRLFPKELKAPTVLDIGSNRGFFIVVADKLLQAEKIICVEPQSQLKPIRRLLASSNNISPHKIFEYDRFCSSASSENTISLNEIVQEHKLASIDFLKMDVEGAEEAIFSGNLEWLSLCKNLAMEIHYGMANVSFIPELLRSKGFKCVLTNLRGRPIPDSLSGPLPSGCAYLYASSN